MSTTREELFALLEARKYWWYAVCAELADCFPTALEEIESFVETKYHTTGELVDLMYSSGTDSLTYQISGNAVVYITIPLDILMLTVGEEGVGVTTNYLNTTPTACIVDGDDEGPTSRVRQELEDVQRAFPDMFIDFDRLEEVNEELRNGVLFRGVTTGVMQ